MRELVSATLGCPVTSELLERVCDRYAPFGARLLTDPQGQVKALRFNFSGLMVTVTEPALLAQLQAQYQNTAREALLGQLKHLALELIAHEPGLCERLVLRAYEAGFADRDSGNCCASFQHEARL